MSVVQYKKRKSIRGLRRKFLADWTALGNSIAQKTKEEWLHEEQRKYAGSHVARPGASFHPPGAELRVMKRHALERDWHQWDSGNGKFEEYVSYRLVNGHFKAW